MTFHAEITGFFAEYIKAFARNDADALSGLWDEVGLFPSPNGNFAMERRAFRDHCVTLMDFYRGQGVVQPKGELLSAKAVSRSDCRAVRQCWTLVVGRGALSKRVL